MSAPIDLVGIAYRGSDGAATCCLCDNECEWQDCQACGGDGYFDGYEEDPNWYEPGEDVPCRECRGQGGYYYCTDKECRTFECRKVLPEKPTADAMLAARKGQP